MVIALVSKPGLSSATTLSIPKTWDASWFRNLISNQLKGADVRNAVGTNGITVSGNIASPYATIALGVPFVISGTTVSIPTGSLVVGAPTGGSEGVGTINATGYYLNGVNQLQSGSFTGTITGCTTVVTGTFHYTIANNICTISLANLTNVTGTSNSTSMTLTGLPAVCQPATQQPLCLCIVEDNSVAALALALIIQSGTVTFFKATFPAGVLSISSSGFTGSGTKGMDSTVLTYSLQ